MEPLAGSVGIAGLLAGNDNGASCPKCGSTNFTDPPIHDGQSTRRDCANCGRLIGYPKWHGVEGQDALEQHAVVNTHGANGKAVVG